MAVKKILMRKFMLAWVPILTFGNLTLNEAR